jgi:hypothetical protein
MSAQLCCSREDLIGTAAEHWQEPTYITPTTRPGRVPQIGVGLTFNEGRQSEPWVVVHLDGDNMDEDAGPAATIDVDTHMTVDEAIELRDLLDVAISQALGVETP